VLVVELARLGQGRQLVARRAPRQVAQRECLRSRETRPAQLGVRGAQDVLRREAAVRAREQRAHARVDGRGGAAVQLLIDDRLGEHPEDTARAPELEREGSGAVHDSRERGVRGAQPAHRGLGVEGEPAVAFEGRLVARRVRGLEHQQTLLGSHAAADREPAEPSAGTEHAVTGHDHGERVSPERLADGACLARLTEALRQLAVAGGRPRGHGARRFVDAARERRHAFEVQDHLVERARLA
jgi:hypothetical protein